jgi:CBS domain-containing protein
VHGNDVRVAVGLERPRGEGRPARALLRDLAHGAHERDGEPVPVRSIMKTDPVTVAPDTPTLEAVEIMRRHNCGCLPVVLDDHLVGIVTAYDFLAVSAKLFEEQLKN